MICCVAVAEIFGSVSRCVITAAGTNQLVHLLHTTVYYNYTHNVFLSQSNIYLQLRNINELTQG